MQKCPKTHKMRKQTYFICYSPNCTDKFVPCPPPKKTAKILRRWQSNMLGTTCNQQNEWQSSHLL